MTKFLFQRVIQSRNFKNSQRIRAPISLETIPSHKSRQNLKSQCTHPQTTRRNLFSMWSLCSIYFLTVQIPHHHYSRGNHLQKRNWHEPDVCKKEISTSRRGYSYIISKRHIYQVQINRRTLKRVFQMMGYSIHWSSKHDSAWPWTIV